jgi:hypothetical protein
MDVRARLEALCNFGAQEQKEKYLRLVKSAATVTSAIYTVH